MLDSKKRELIVGFRKRLGLWGQFLKSVYLAFFFIGTLAHGAANFKMFGLDNVSAKLVEIDLSLGTATAIADLPFSAGWSGFDYNPADKCLYAAIGGANRNQAFYRIQTSSGATGKIGDVYSQGGDGSFESIGFRTDGSMLAYDEHYDMTSGNLLSVNLVAGTSQVLGSSGTPSILGGDYDNVRNTFWASDEWNGKLYQLNPSNGSVVWTSTSTWYTGNGPGDMFDVDVAPDGMVYVVVSDNGATKILKCDPTTGTWITQCTLGAGLNSNLRIASVPLTDLGAPPTITSTNSFRGTVGVTFSNAVTATGTTPITYSGSNLPSGLIITTNGSITGKPLVAGTNYTLLTAMNAYGTNRQTNTFIIAKGTPTVSNWPTASEITYGQSLSNSVLFGGSASVTGSFAWTYPTYKPNAGSNNQSVTFAPTATNNYVSVSTNIFIAVNKATPVLTWTPSPAAYLTYPAPLTSTQLNATSSVAGTFSYNPAAGTVLNVGRSTLVATFTPTSTSNYISGSKITNWVFVAKGTPTISLTPVASPITFGQALSQSVLSGGSASVAGRFSFASPSFVPPSGSSAQSIFFIPTDSVNYMTVSTQVVVTVLPVPVKEDVLYGTIAGLAGSPGSADGVGAAAKFMGARGVATDALGNVYVADTGNHTIRKVSTSGQVTTIAGTAGQAGTANGLGAVARFRGPWALAVGADGVVYVADTENHAIRKISSSGEVTILAGSPGIGGSQDGTGTGARFYRPMGIAVDASGTVYVADTGNHTVRMITSAGVVTRVAGRASFAGYVDGGVSQSMLSSPMGLALAADGSVWVADSNNFVLRKLSAGILSTIAGVGGESDLINGQGSEARLQGPIGLTMDGEGSVYFSELSSQYIRKCTAGGLVSTWAGVPNSPGAVDGAYAEVKFYQPAGLAMDGQGNLYVADSGNSTIRMGRATPSNPILAVLRSRQVTESTFPCR